MTKRNRSNKLKVFQEIAIPLSLLVSSQLLFDYPSAGKGLTLSFAAIAPRLMVLSLYLVYAFTSYKATQQIASIRHIVGIFFWTFFLSLIPMYELLLIVIPCMIPVTRRYFYWRSLRRESSMDSMFNNS